MSEGYDIKIGNINLLFSISNDKFLRIISVNSDDNTNRLIDEYFCSTKSMLISNVPKLSGIYKLTYTGELPLYQSGIPSIFANGKISSANLDDLKSFGISLYGDNNFVVDTSQPPTLKTVIDLYIDHIIDKNKGVHIKAARVLKVNCKTLRNRGHKVRSERPQIFSLPIA